VQVSKRVIAGLALCTAVAVIVMIKSGTDPDSYFRNWPGRTPWIALIITASLMTAESALAFYALLGRTPKRRSLRCAIALIPLGMLTAVLIAGAMHAPGYHFIHLYWSLAMLVLVLITLAATLLTGVIKYAKSHRSAA
jgi:hypothetical protein